MKDIFYNLEDLDFNTLKKLFTDSVLKSYNTRVEKLENIYRTIDEESTIEIALNHISKANHNNLILRKGITENSKDYYELAYRNFGTIDKFLYIYLSIEEGEKIINIYNLKKR